MRFKQSTILVFTVEMSGDDVRVEFHPSMSALPSHRLWRVTLCRGGEPLARDWFASVTESPRSRDAAYYIAKHVVAPVLRPGMRHGDPHRRPSTHDGASTAALAVSQPESAEIR